MSSVMGLTNLVKTATLTASSEVTGFLKENAATWKLSSWWSFTTTGATLIVDLGSAQSVDCMGLAGLNCAEVSCSIKLQSSTTGAWAGEEVDRIAAYTPSADVTQFKTFTSASARYWRFVFASNTAQVFIANVFLGAMLELQHGMIPNFSPANLNREREIFNNNSQGGNFLGSAVMYNAAKITIEQEYVTRTWIDANWLTVADHIELYPFYFAWDTVNYPNEVAYCKAKKINYPEYMDPFNMRFSLECGAYYD